MNELIKLSEVGIIAASEASKKIKTFLSEGFKIDMKGPANLVTEADIAAEKIIVESIRETFPHHSFLGEESEKADLDSENLWVIDPIDGTTNFTHGVPVVGISIAFSHKGELLTGCVLNPFTGDLYSAVKGLGATLNENKISVSKAQNITESLIATGFFYGQDDRLADSLQIAKSLIDRKCHGIRRMGAASIDLCYVACGLFDGYYELKLHPWDFAAGTLIVREAGGKVVNVSGENLKLTDEQLIATNGIIESELLDVVRNVG